MKLSTRAIVLSKQNFGEADCYIQFYTRDWGLISTLAKSARKSKRRYVGGLDIFCHNEIFLRGDPKDRPYLEELVVLNAFTGIRDSLDRVMLAGRLTEWVKRLANVPTAMPTIYSLLGQTLALIEKESDSDRLDLLGMLFKLKLLGQLGLKPHMDACARCSEVSGEEPFFDISSGGLLCQACRRSGAMGAELVKLSPDEKSFLETADLWKLSQWTELRFPQARVPSLSRLLNQFATFHTHVRLPI